MLDISEILERWESQGVELLAPNDRATVIGALNLTGKKYSEDVVNLYCATGGMKDGAMDDNLWSFWSLEQLVKENAVLRRPGLFFADFLIYSTQYFFRFESPDRSSVWLDDGQELLADSISEFFEKYLKNPAVLGLFA